MPLPSLGGVTLGSVVDPGLARRLGAACGLEAPGGVDRAPGVSPTVPRCRAWSPAGQAPAAGRAILVPSVAACSRLEHIQSSLVSEGLRSPERSFLFRPLPSAGSSKRARAQQWPQQPRPERVQQRGPGAPLLRHAWRQRWCPQDLRRGAPHWNPDCRRDFCERLSRGGPPCQSGCLRAHGPPGLGGPQ